ncbi:MAG TPA: sulfite exporter TauE/SafE family protein [Devosiaceae bacterium]|nr:sulfite exporter TauE/SafE family protein [Devosiaceae bacterium]
MPESLLLLPPGLDLLPAVGLVVLSFVTSAITATFGLGGGAMLIAVMVLVLPPVVAVPVHGLVQFGSNAGRAILMRAHVQWRFAGYFLLGSAAGALLGGRVATMLPEAVFTALIAIFILWSAWAPKPSGTARGPLATAAAGLVTAAIGMITGVSGPLVIAFLRFLPDRHQIIATHALLMTAQNAFKAVAFAAFGFAFVPYLPLVALMVATGFAGTWTGRRLLARVPEQGFRWGFRIILSLVAVNLLWAAIT